MPDIEEETVVPALVPTSAIVIIVDGAIALRLEKRFSDSWSTSRGTCLCCLVDGTPYQIRFLMDTVDERPSDGALVLESDEVSLDEIRSKGVRIALSAVEASLRKSGWVDPTPWKRAESPPPGLFHISSHPKTPVL